MRPWRRSPRHRRPRVPINGPTDQIPPGPHSLTNFNGYMNSSSNQGFPDFSSRLSPVGGPQSKGKKQKSGKDYVDSPTGAEESSENRSSLKIPENPAPSRPPLSNIFPMLSNPSKVSPQIKKSSNKRPADQRRHSTPITPLSEQASPTHGERRASASSDTSADKRHGRRERRASATRELPLLPKRGDSPFQPTTPPGNPTTPEQVTPYSMYSGVPDLSSPNQISMDFGPVRQPPIGAPSAFIYPPASWPLPHHQLQELEEELEEDGEGDGEEEEPAVIDEEWEGFEQSGSMPDPSFKGARMGPNTLPVAYMGPAGAEPADPMGPREPPQGKGALGKILRIMSSSSSSKTKPKPAIVVNVPKGVVLEEEEDDSDVKGFDNFFMY